MIWNKLLLFNLSSPLKKLYLLIQREGQLAEAINHTLTNHPVHLVQCLSFIQNDKTCPFSFSRSKYTFRVLFSFLVIFSLRRVGIILLLLIDVIRLYLISIPMGIYVTRLYLLLPVLNTATTALSPLFQQHKQLLRVNSMGRLLGTKPRTTRNPHPFLNLGIFFLLFGRCQGCNVFLTVGEQCEY